MTRRRAATLGILTVLFLLAAVYFITPKISLPNVLPANTVAPGYYRVTQIYDGDTFAVDMNGSTEKIRLIGIDTPETHKPGAPVQCFGPQASAFAEQTLTGRAVKLEADPIGDNRDRYNRLLRYAYLADGTLLNQKLISEGYAFAYLSFPFQKHADFDTAHTAAETAKKGLWAVCQPTLKGERWQSNNL